MITCPECGNDQNSKIMGHEIRGVYDGVLYWSCMICGTAFQRWPEGDRLHDRAVEFIDRHNFDDGTITP